MKIIKSTKFCEAISWFFDVGGITIYPFIILREDCADEVTINHESIHIQQQKESLVIGFYLIYLITWIFNLFKYKDTFEAYNNICFEKEAYANQENLNYLKDRKMYSWLHKTT